MKICICQIDTSKPLPYRFLLNIHIFICNLSPTLDCTEVGKTFFLGLLKIFKNHWVEIKNFDIICFNKFILFTFVQNFKNLKRYDESKPNLIRPNQANDIQAI